MSRYRLAVPVWLLVLLILSFGLLIPWLGFYWDDWPVILTGKLQGAAGFWQFYQYDRPISAWTYILTFPLLGSRPIAWHIFTLLLRWGTAAALWWTLARLWPNHRREASWTAALFAIYPVFTQQSIAVAYSQHWICYLLFFVSLGCMVEAWRVRQAGRRGFRLLTAAALAASLLQLLTMEYFAGLELLRPILLWFLACTALPTARQRLSNVAHHWLPYLLELAAFSIWRLFFLKFPGADANPPGLLMRMFSDPANALLRFAQIVLQDTLHLLVSVWANILAPANLDLSDHFLLFTWVWTILIAVAAIIVLRLAKDDALSGEIEKIKWSHQALIVGITAILLGMLPVWFTDRQIIVGIYSNRFGLPAMLGTSLVIVGLLEEIIARKAQRILLLALLIGLAGGAHLRVANDFRWSWIRQTRFYWNLAWRAPGLQPGTAITPEGEIFSYVGIYSTAAGINLVYPPTGQSAQLPYWFYSLGREYAYIISSFQKGMPLETSFRHYTFKGNSKDVLVVLYLPSEHHCVEVLTPSDANAPGIPDVSVSALTNSNLERIRAEATPGYPPQDIFGAEPEHGWCYLYEKADLARQLKNWSEIASLGDQAQDAGYTPLDSAADTPFEWLPFIEGYARTGQWQKAEEISRQAVKKDAHIQARMCSLWSEISAAVAGGDQPAARLRSEFGCK
jgi:hypothetical protein